MGNLSGRQSHATHEVIQKAACLVCASSANIIDLISNLPVYSTAVVIAIFTQGPFYSLIQYLTVGYQALYK